MRDLTYDIVVQPAIFLLPEHELPAETYVTLLQ